MKVVLKGGKGSGWYGPPKGTHTGEKHRAAGSGKAGTGGEPGERSITTHEQARTYAKNLLDDKRWRMDDVWRDGDEWSASSAPHRGSKMIVSTSVQFDESGKVRSVEYAGMDPDNYMEIGAVTRSELIGPGPAERLIAQEYPED